MNAHKKILIVGASGFVGRRLAAALSGDGHQVIALARRTPAPEYPARIEVVTASLDNSAEVEALLKNCSAVFHVASDSTPGTTASQPALEAGLNIVPTLRLLESLQKFPEVPLIYLSSGGAVYAPLSNDPLVEESNVQPVSYYGAGKVAIEKFINAMVSQHGGRALILRPSNIYGPGQHFRRGFGLIPTLFQHTQNGETLNIWGDGEVVRDYLFIDDFLMLCLAIANSRFAFAQFEICNAGSGIGCSVNQLCREVEKVTGRTLERNYLPSRRIDLQRIVLDSKKAERLFNWQANTSLTSGLSQSWTWFEQYAQRS